MKVGAYRTYSVKEKMVDAEEKDQSERWFHPNWPEIKYVARANKDATSSSTRRNRPGSTL